MSASQIGVFGGTFDPPHVGHLIVARDAGDELALDRVLLVLSARPPHRSHADVTPAAVRWAMLEAAVADDPLLEASDLETRRPGPSYTADTLAELRRRDPAAQLVLLMGVDQWRQLESWHEPERIGHFATVAVMERAGEAAGGLGLRVPWRHCPVTRVEISSTGIRARVRARRSIRHMVPDPVRSIIEREGLYSTREPSVATTGMARHVS